MPGYALGKCLGGLSFGISMSYSHSEDDKVVAGESDPSEYDEVATTKDTETIDASCPTLYVQSGDSLHWWGNQFDNSGPMCWGWVLTPGSNSTECLYRVVQWQ